MSLKKHIPNTITVLNLLSGCVAVYFASIEQMYIAAFFTLLGIFFDFFDGFFARIFKVQSELGLQLDSMADMITSGMLPGMLMFQLLKKSSLIAAYFPVSFPSNIPLDYIAFFGFVITAASGYRLAKFNIDTRQTSAFIGLPTPANTLLILSVTLIVYYQPQSNVAYIFSDTYVLLLLTAVSAYLLNAELPLFALKFKNWSFSDNWMRYVTIIFSLILVGVFQYAGILLTILFYILLSVYLNFRKQL